MQAMHGATVLKVMSDLKIQPCPFTYVRHPKEKLSVQKFPGLEYISAVYCDNCGAWGPGMVNTEDAVRAWNERNSVKKI